MSLLDCEHLSYVYRLCQTIAFILRQHRPNAGALKCTGIVSCNVIGFTSKHLR